eukprot:TRINITY_DN6_c0_g1_i1.p1 TRINITY_DN6_c0_g1~~TRINITY_DN6_c0_g1_i1.p1  ORF type:complete len:439 (+),score=138.75 TRINITY_DN6_c0_g1_i1:50-1318(+)
MATIVCTSDEEPILTIVRFSAELAWAGAEAEVSAPAVTQAVAEAERLLGENRVASLLGLLLTSADVLLVSASEKDCECVFSLIISLVTKSQGAEEEKSMASDIAAKLTQVPGTENDGGAISPERVSLHVRLLFLLYNVLSFPSTRFLIFMQILGFAVAVRAADLVLPAVRRVEALVKEWGGVSMGEQRGLFLTASNILREVKGGAKDSYSLLLKYLGTFSASEEDEGAMAAEEVRDAAVRATVEFIKQADAFQCDLLDLAPVRKLERDTEYSLLFSLLEIFLKHRLDAYYAFHQKNAAFMKEMGLVHEECETKMRLMSLASLAAESQTGEVRYATVRDMLKIEEDDVEVWVVRAIAAKLLEGRMNELRQVILVNRCSHRVFGPAQWRDLKERLQHWKEGIINIQRVVQTAKEETVGGLVDAR